MEEQKPKIKRRSKKKKQEITYSLILIIILVGSGLYFYKITRPDNSVARKPFVPSIAPPKSQSSAQNPTQIFFASNGKISVYKIEKDNKWSIIFNGIQSKSYDYVSNPVFSPDGTQFAYNAETGNQAYVVVNNNQIINAYQKADNIVFSQNNQTIAFLAAKNDNTYVVISSQVASTGSNAAAQNGTESQPITNPGTVTTPDGNSTSIVISANGSQVAYAVQNGNQTSIVVNGQTTATYDNISNLIVNNDGTCSYQAQEGGQTVTVVDNQVTSTSSSSSSNGSSGSSTTTSSSSGNTSAQNSSSGNSSSPNYYKYQYVSGQDVRMDPNRLDYSPCQTGNCSP
jgi:hypothetical protein